MDERQTPVLVVGGGLVGLSASLFLAWHGVEHVLVERRAATSQHPRAWGWYPRTLELLRTVGLERDVLEVSAGSVGHTLNAEVESLLGRELSSTHIPDPDDVGDVSPVRRIVSLSQDRLEPLIARRATELGADLRFGTELVDLVIDDDGASATLRDVDPDGQAREQVLRARYVIAADGPNSGIRERLGIARTGRGVLRHQVSILFSADLEGPLRGRRFAICRVRNDQVEGVLGHDDSLRRGTLIVTCRPDRGEDPADFTEQHCVELVRAAVGDPEFAVSIRSVMPWQMAALTAQRFSAGPVFLVGDAAHVIPPVGGYGANTGIQDAHNLAWKLAAVLAGTAGPALLDTYDAERRPVATSTTMQATMRLAVRRGAATDAQRAATADTLAVTTGYRYRSAAIGASEEDPQTDPEVPVHPRELTGRPGTRAPHLVVRRSGTRISLLDLFGSAPVLLVGADAAVWADAAGPAADRAGTRLDVHRAGTDFVETDRRWHEAYGVESTGAVLVRPDGFVCWRAVAGPDGVGPQQALESALDRMLGRCPAVV